MAFGFQQGYGDPNPPAPAPAAAPDLAAEVERLKQQAEEQNRQFQALRNHSLQATTTANQQIDLLRGQLSEQIGKQSHQPVAPAAGQTDDWMSFLTGGAQPAPQTGTSGQPAPALRAGLTEEQVRQVYRDEERKRNEQYAQEHQAVATLNSRFMVEYPEHAKNPLAIDLIKNQFQAVSNLRPDLSPDMRYKMAIENAVKALLPTVQPYVGQKTGKPTKEKVEEKQPNPYMPNLFQAAPGTRSLEQQLGMVSNESLDDKYTKRERELKEWREKQRAMQGR